MEIIQDREQNRGWRLQKIRSRIEDGDHRGQGVEQRMEIIEDKEQNRGWRLQRMGVEQRMEVIEDGSRIEDGDHRLQEERRVHY